MIITGSIFVIALLIVRLIFTQAANSREEKKWYVTQLRLDFSAKVDSVKIFNKKTGLVFFHLTRGSIIKQAEKRLNKKLKYNGNLRFLYFTKTDEIEIVTSNAALYTAGDSLSVNTDLNSIIIYRNGGEAARAEVVESLRGRPF